MSERDLDLKSHDPNRKAFKPVAPVLQGMVRAYGAIVRALDDISASWTVRPVTKPRRSAG